MIRIGKSLINLDRVDAIVRAPNNTDGGYAIYSVVGDISNSHRDITAVRLLYKEKTEIDAESERKITTKTSMNL